MHATRSAPSASTPAASLQERYLQLLATHPQARARDAAAELGISEAELVTLQGGVRLRPAWGEILQAMPRLGRVMVLTRNEACVHERHGCFEQVDINGGMGLVLGPDIDLRLFLRRWAFGFACTQALPSGLRKSFQFFDASGQAIHKIYLTEACAEALFDEITEQFREPHPEAAPAIQPIQRRPADRPDAEIDTAGLVEAWQNMRDTHDFFGMLARFRVGRQQALRLAGAPLARPAGAESARQVLETAAACGEPIMCFVGNPGCIQIHTGAVQRVERRGPWLNVLDTRFNLHLREDLIAASWLVRKPTEDGVVSSLELFDHSGELVVQFFGQRKPGQPEREGWRRLLAGVSTQVTP
jgi:putative hemin transport protein